MARTREFEPEEALNKVVQVFWRNGYAETSMEDLVAETGVSRYGLYGTFGDKRALFDKALDQFARQMRATLQAPLRGERAGRAAIVAYFDSLLALAGTPMAANGCMICNAMTERTPHDDEIADKLREFYAEVGDVFATAIRNGQADGDIAPELDAADTGIYFSGILQGLAVMARGGTGADRMTAYVRTALKVLDRV